MTDNRPAHQRTTDKSVGGNLPETYGEPKGPTPPHFEIRPKAEIDANRAASKRAEPGPTGDRERDDFHGGISSPEAGERVTGPERNNP